jgi:exonuclease SbcC
MPKDGLEVLEQKLDALKNKIEQKTVLEMEINELRLGEMEIKSSIQTLENLIRLKESLKEKKDKIDELEKQRKDIINELKFLEIKKGQFLRIDNLDEFENRSLKEIESLKESITYIKDETSLLEKNISQNIGAINSKNKEIRKLTQTIEEKDRRLQKEIEDNLKIKKEVFEKLKRVTDEQFENEKSFKDSIDQELIKINSTIQKHNTELQALNSKLRDLSKKELDIQKENLIQEMEKAQKSLGIEESKIKKAKKLREDYKHLENEIKILEDELALLSKLNDLIGSHDGSKFSNYAQALTMDYLLNLANSHLKVLNPRYRLIQKRTENIKERLGLMVIDTHFIDAKRGVATLSGGEKFVVSLALALGLSDLAGDKIKVETLFLDEGFGSLDPETLDIVLEVLDNLRAQNRVIGLISHIEMIKERVQNGIEVKIDASGIGYLNDRFRVNKK